MTTTGNIITSQTNGINKQWRDLESLKKEHERLQTFSGWTCGFVNSENLAKAGFFYLKKFDHVQCAFCRGVIGEWEEGDDPEVEHRKHFHWCPFINGLPVGNRKIGEPEPLQIESRSEVNGYDTCKRYIRPHAHPERSEHWNNDTNSSLTATFEGLGILAHDTPVHEKYSILAKRLESYKNWPESVSQQPQQLAEAGFFYIDLSDHVRCFHCAGGLRNWTAGDDPWEEHARWFSRCTFLLVSKGKEYVDSVLQNNPPILSEEECSHNNNTPEVSSNEQNGCTSLEPGYSNNSESQNHNLEVATPLLNGSPKKQLLEGNQTPVVEMSKQESESSDESRLCKVCFAEDVGVAIFPCGHLCGTACIAALKNCPICRGEIKGTLRIYM